jgi:hypothetical protein
VAQLWPRQDLGLREHSPAASRGFIFRAWRCKWQIPHFCSVLLTCMASGETAVVGVPDASALALPSPPFDSSRLPPFPSPSDNHGYLSPPNPILRSEVDRTSIENGQRIFGQNIVSRRLIKSWLQQMWLGLKDKVLVSSK